MSDADRLISIDTTQPQGSQLPAEVQAEIAELIRHQVSAATYPTVHFLMFGFKAATTPPPEMSEIRLNHADPLQATVLYPHRIGTGPIGYVDVFLVLSQIGVGSYCYLQSGYDPSLVVVYRVSAPAKALPSISDCEYFEIEVEAVSADPVVFVDGIAPLTVYWPH